MRKEAPLLIYPKLPNVSVNFLLDEGGLGDNIARMPAIRYIKNHHPHAQPIVWVPDYFCDFARNILPDIEFRKFSDSLKYDETLPTRSTGAKWFTNLKTRMDVHAFALLANEIPEEPEHYNYPQVDLKRISIGRFNLPEKFVVITTAFTASVREFYPQYVNEVVSYCLDKGYKIIFLGKKETLTGSGPNITGNLREEIDYSKGLNLIDRTTLLDAAKIMSKAKCVLGVDNGLLHVAACTDVAIIGGYTTVDPKHRLPFRHNESGWNYQVVVPPDSEPEKFWQSRVDFEFEHDFRFSYFQNDDLVKSLQTSLWIEKLEKIL